MLQVKALQAKGCRKARAGLEGRGVLLPVRMLRWAFCSQDAVVAPWRCFMPHSCNLVKSGSKVELEPVFLFL